MEATRPTPSNVSFSANMNARTTADRVLVPAATLAAIALYVGPLAWATRRALGSLGALLVFAAFMLLLGWAYGRALMTAEVGPERLRFVPRRGDPISVPWSQVTRVERLAPARAALRLFLPSLTPASPSASLTGNFRIHHTGGVIAFTPDEVERFELALERWRGRA